MFYLKHKGKKLTIESDNVYTQCPRCGKEFPIDLADMGADGQLDLYGTSVYCWRCRTPVYEGKADTQENRR